MTTYGSFIRRSTCGSYRDILSDIVSYLSFSLMAVSCHHYILWYRYPTHKFAIKYKWNDTDRMCTKPAADINTIVTVVNINVNNSLWRAAKIDAWCWCVCSLCNGIIHTYLATINLRTRSHLFCLTSHKQHQHGNITNSQCNMLITLTLDILHFLKRLRQRNEQTSTASS